MERSAGPLLVINGDDLEGELKLEMSWGPESEELERP